VSQQRLNIQRFAHDLDNDLQIISSCCDFLFGLTLNHPESEYVLKIQGAAARMAMRIRDASKAAGGHLDRAS